MSTGIIYRINEVLERKITIWKPGGEKHSRVEAHEQNLYNDQTCTSAFDL